MIIWECTDACSCIKLCLAEQKVDQQDMGVCFKDIEGGAFQTTGNESGGLS